MDWLQATFFHWPIAKEALRARLPTTLEVETFDGSAWIGVVAFRMHDVRLRGVPPPLALRTFGEVNVRTYVRSNDSAGVWFFSLDAADPFMVQLGRDLIRVPYHLAAIALDESPRGITYRSVRRSDRAAFNAECVIGEPVETPTQRDRWFVERYCFYTEDSARKLVRGDVVHDPWPLRSGSARIDENTLLRPLEFEVDGDPIVHYSQGVSVRTMLPRRVG